MAGESDFQFETYDVDDQIFHLTYADPHNFGCQLVVAVTDEENDVHYVCESITSETNFGMSTIPDGYGIPEEIEEVPTSRIDDLNYLMKEKDLEGLQRSLSSLGDDVLGPDSSRQKPSDSSAIKAERMMAMRDFEESPYDHL